MAAGLGGKMGVEVFKAAPGERLFHRGEAELVLEMLHEGAHFRAAGGQGDVAGLGRGDEAAGGGVVDRGGVEAGAGADHQRGGVAGSCVGLDHRNEVVGRDMAYGVALRLQVVQQRHVGGAGGAADRVGVHRPVDVRQFGPAVLHRAGDGDAGALAPGHAARLEIGGEDRLKPLVVGVAEAFDGAFDQSGTVGQGDAGVGAADVGDKAGVVGQGRGHGGADPRMASLRT